MIATVEILGSMWSVLSLVLIAFITQRVIAWREKKKSLDDERRKSYLEMVPTIARLFMAASDSGTSPMTSSEIQKEYMEFMLRLTIIGSTETMEAFNNFIESVMSIGADGAKIEVDDLREKASAVTCAMCCDIHGESHTGKPRYVEVLNRMFPYKTGN